MTSAQENAPPVWSTGGSTDSNATILSLVAKTLCTYE